MAKLKSLKIKDKTFIIRAFDNPKNKNPAKVIFARFPLSEETFTKMDRKNLFEGIDIANIKSGDKQVMKKITDNLVNGFISNMSAGIIDYQSFMKECVSSFVDFEYGKDVIQTVDDFWQKLPREAAYIIAHDMHEYAKEADEFSMGESKA